MPLNNRLKTYTHMSTELTCLSDVQLSDALHKAKPLHTGIGGRSVLLEIDQTPVFVKKVPLTDLERQPQHVMSTANIFELPLFYQYGVGSTGFGAWRELVAHVMTTNWVLAGESPHFPLMYHWRVLSTQPEDPNIRHWGDLEKYIQYWDNSAAVRNRGEAIHSANAQIVLFLEYVPQTLHQWLGTQIQAGGNTAETAVSFVDKTLKITNHFTNGRGFFHFDGHFENILTDGKFLYFTDFGLALSSKFDLTKEEREFLSIHHTYDRCASIVNLLHSVITSLFGKDQWEVWLENNLKDNQGALPSQIAPLIKRYAPIALVMDKFYRALQKESKSTPYPAAQLAGLLNEIEKEKK